MIYGNIFWIEKLPLASVKPANQLLLSIDYISKPKKGIKLFSFSFIHVIALCKGSILGVRILPLIRLIIFKTSCLANICSKTRPALDLSITLPTFNPADNFSAKGLS